MTNATARHDADVIVVGAGPAGSSAAYHLARQGLDVMLLEKSQFPREKVCGDGLTPRAVHQLLGMGIDITTPGWRRNKGLRLVSGPHRIELDWPALERFPDFGLTRTRQDFDDILARQAVRAGARMHTSTKATAPLLDRGGRVIGVEATTGTGHRNLLCYAPVVVAADGVSARLALALGIEHRRKCPMGIAVRRYFHSPRRHDDNYLESWLDLRSPGTGTPLPGYGWIFGLGDGRVNVGLGTLNTISKTAFDTRTMLSDWLSRTPAAWGLTDETNADGPVRGAALPMGFSRLPHYTRGMILVGDAGGMVNPFNGEGIPYAMESGELAADVIAQALARPAGPGREHAMEHYPNELLRRHGRYYKLANGFSTLLAKPAFTTLVTRHAMRSPLAMRFMFRLLTNLTDDPGSDALDRLANAMVRMVPTRTHR